MGRVLGFEAFGERPRREVAERGMRAGLVGIAPPFCRGAPAGSTWSWRAVSDAYDVWSSDQLPTIAVWTAPRCLGHLRALQTLDKDCPEVSASIYDPKYLDNVFFSTISVERHDRIDAERADEGGEIRSQASHLRKQFKLRTSLIDPFDKRLCALRVSVRLDDVREERREITQGFRRVNKSRHSDATLWRPLY